MQYLFHLIQPLSRIEENDVVTRRETILYNKSVPVKVTYKLNKGNCILSMNNYFKSISKYTAN